MKTARIFICIISVLVSLTTFSQTKLPPYQRPEGMIRGGEFMDLFLPVPVIDGLENDLWGVDAVIPRDADNGLEDGTYSYWGGNIVVGDDGKYHAFICRWREDNTKGSKSGHHTWWSSIVTHAMSDSPIGPFKVLKEIGPGHNPEIYRKKDGAYIIGIMGENHYHAEAINGPWEMRKTRMEKLSDYINVTNRTYVVRKDSSVYMMNKSGVVFISENADEHFDQVTEDYPYNHYPGSHQEDPVVWKDEVQYHCIYNDAFGRVGSYMRSADGINWKGEKGVAYDPTIIKHTDGTQEGWYKMERPKVILDEYGRVTHMNFAAMDTTKDEDVANDNHSSKNIIVPLTITRRLEILNTERLTKTTKEIKVKIYADADFNPQRDMDLKSLVFGAPELVNVGKGCEATKIKASGADAIITFKGENNGLSSDNFAAKLLGKTTKGNLIYGFAKLKFEVIAKGNMQSSGLPDSIPNDGYIPVQIDFETNKLSKIAVSLVNKKNNKVAGQKNHYVSNKGKATIYVPLSAIETGRDTYQWKVYLYPDDLDNPDGNTSYLDSIIKDVTVFKEKKQILLTGSWNLDHIKFSSESHHKYKAANAFDGNADTHWEPHVSREEWVQASLHESIIIKGMKIKFLRGDLRRFNIEIQGSKDGVSWDTYFTGESELAHDLTSLFIFDKAKACKHIKVICKGSNRSSLNGIYEIVPILSISEKGE